MIKRFFAWWKAIAVIALFFILITFLLEFFVHLEGQEKGQEKELIKEASTVIFMGS